MSFTLDNATTGTLGGIQEAQTESTIEDRGQSITLAWSQSGADQDLELYGYSLRLAPAESDAPDANLGNLTTLTKTAYGDGLYGAGPYGGLSGSGTGIFILDISTLGTLMLNAVTSIVQDRGRAIQLTWSQSGADQDLELFGYSVLFAPAEPMAVEIV